MATTWGTITSRALQALLAIAFVIGTLPLASAAAIPATWVPCPLSSCHRFGSLPMQE
jgi:hypothetical protein